MEKTFQVGITKQDEDKHLVYGEVYIPDVPDSQGDFMTADGIMNMAHAFIAQGLTSRIDTSHDGDENGSLVVESFVAREGDPDFVKGAWVLGVKVIDDAVWKAVKDGELNSFSMAGTGKRIPSVIEIDVPEDGIYKGETYGDDHVHGFAIQIDVDTGRIKSGETDVAKGHSHAIRGGSVTEPGPDGHVHRYAFIGD